MKIVWLAVAEHDVGALINYIVQDSPQNALQIFATIRVSIEKLALYPYAGREGRIEGTRELVIPNLPYIVVYQITQEIRILAVVHTSRKWPNAF